MAGILVLKYYIQTHALTSRTECGCPGSVCSKDTACQIKHVQLRTEIVRFQIGMLPGRAVNHEGMTL